MMIVIQKHDAYNTENRLTTTKRAPMGHSQADKAQSRDRILKEAAAQIRDGGLESVSVNKLMRSVNLTHGGFYGHFPSRSELLAVALERALVEGAAASKSGTDPERPMNFEAFTRSYLSRAHRDSRKAGCAIAALASDVARADDRSRDVMAAHIDRFIGRVAAALDSDDEQAMFAASALVGGLLLSRVATDPKRSDAMLRAVKQGLVSRQKTADKTGP
jgi:TetR/AcrR family transcriptional repressor of nem operon